MSSDDDWITIIITKARIRNPSVTEAVSVRTETLLKGRISEVQLTPAELKLIAKRLIEDMVPAPPTADPTQ